MGKGSSSTNFQAFLQDELPLRVRRELVSAVESELEPVEERLRIRLHDIVRIVHRQILQSFQQSSTPTDDHIVSGASLLPAPSGVTAPEDTSALLLPSQFIAEDVSLAPWWDPSYASNLDFQHETQLENGEEIFSDPGYGTTPSSAPNTSLATPPDDQSARLAKERPDENETLDWWEAGDGGTSLEDLGAS